MFTLERHVTYVLHYSIKLYSHIYISGDILEKMLIILGPRLTVQYAYNLSILTNLKNGKALFDLIAVFNYLFIPVHLQCHIK